MPLWRSALRGRIVAFKDPEEVEVEIRPSGVRMEVGCEKTQPVSS